MATAARPLEEELVRTPVTLGTRTLPLWQVGNLDGLVDRMLEEQGDVLDDDIPYYACLWPSARALGQALLEGPPLDGVNALELGCGIGLSGLCAALMGARTTLTDLQPAALELVMRNAAELGVADRVEVQVMDWRTPDAARRADVLLCSDVLYEARFARPLAMAVPSLLAEGGVMLLADPSRPHQGRFLDEAAAVGLEVRAGPLVPAVEGAAVQLFAVAMPGAVRRAPWERG